MGRRWHDNGKYMHKTNTFTDFIACAERLIDAGYTTPEHLAATGGSAGGLLMGAVTNMRPDLFRAVIAHVPFVDVLTTMLDETLPLTVGEWEEWGNPNQEDYYHYMKSYSPYDNVEAKDYPDMLITAGLNDPRVSYWEPAKWSAKLRDMKTGDNVLLLKTNMGAGHGGVSGRYEQFKEAAFEYAFILKRLGLTR
jgi:oligopeptidase B